ncbi:MAG: hypothetical protein ABIL01_15540 [Pseudomonadota bacterium]
MLAGIAMMAAGVLWHIQIAGRLIGGAGSVILSVQATKMLTDWFAGKEIASAMALLVNSRPLGIAVCLLALPWIGTPYGVGAAHLGVAASPSAASCCSRCCTGSTSAAQRLDRIPDGAAAAQRRRGPDYLALGLVSGPPAGPTMSLPARVLQPQTRAIGMGVFFTVFFACMMLGPVLGRICAKWAGSAAAPFDFGAAVILVCPVLLWGFNWIVAAGVKVGERFGRLARDDAAYTRGGKSANFRSPRRTACSSASSSSRRW